MAKQMNPIVKNILVVIIGLVIGSLVNMGIIILFGALIPPPEGVDVNNMESIKANIHKYTSEQFIGPLLAHSLGTLSAAYIVARFAASRHIILVVVIALMFLIGGIMAIMQIGGPVWFTVLDTILAYPIMAFLGHKLGYKK